MAIIRFSLGQLQANCYFVINDKECLIIDPADEASFILEELQRRNLNLVGMLATHGHFDHVMAAGEIQKSLKVPLYIFRKDQFLVDRLIETAQHFLDHSQIIIRPDKIKYLKEGDLKIGNWKLKIIPTPGHTPGSCCFYFKNEGIIFTGDTLFKEGIGRYDFSYSDREELKKSVKKILKLPAETIIYPGHGEKTTIKSEQQNLLHYINIM